MAKELTHAIVRTGSFIGLPEKSNARKSEDPRALVVEIISGR